MGFSEHLDSTSFELNGAAHSGVLQVREREEKRGKREKRRKRERREAREREKRGKKERETFSSTLSISTVEAN